MGIPARLTAITNTDRNLTQVESAKDGTVGDNIVAEHVKNGAVAVGLLATIGGFISRIQTKGGCKIAHDAYDKEQQLERKIITNELANIKEDVGELKQMFMKQYGVGDPSSCYEEHEEGGNGPKFHRRPRR